MVNLHAGIQNHIITQGHAVTHIHLRVNLHVIANGHTVADVSKRADIHIIGQGSALAHMDGLLDAALLGTLAVDKIQQIGEGLIGILNADKRCFDLLLGNEVFADKNSRGLGGIDKMGVFGIGEECQATRRGFLDFCIVVNHGRGVAIYRTVNHRCKLLCSNLHDVVIY